MKAKPLPVHPFAEIKPLGTDVEQAALTSLIKADGQQLPITLYQGKILDGRRRYRACIDLAIEPRFVEYAGDDPIGFVKGMAATANLDETRRALLGANLIDAYAGRRGRPGKERTPQLINGKSAALIGLDVGVSARMVELAVAIKRKSPELYADLMTSKIKTLKAAHTRLLHREKAKTIRQLRRAARVTIADSDLRLGDNVEVLRAIPDGSVQMAFADGPYNCGWSYRADPDRDRLDDDTFLERSARWMAQCARVLADGGSLFVLIDDRYTDHFGMALRSTGLTRRPTIICSETFANYNSAETGLSRNARYLHWYTKGDARLNTIEPRVQSDRNKIGDARGVEEGRLPPNVWSFTRVTSQSKERCPWLGVKGNAPQLPRALPERCILLTTQPGEMVLDCFNGNGITGVAAIANARRYVGIDRDEVGLKQSRAWIEHEVTRLAKERT